MDEFSRNRSSSCPNILQRLNGFYKKLMDEFSRNWFSSCPGNRNFEKILDEFSRNPSVSHPEKLKFWKNFWVSYPGFANKG